MRGSKSLDRTIRRPMKTALNRSSTQRETLTRTRARLSQTGAVLHAPIWLNPQLTFTAFCNHSPVTHVVNPLASNASTQGQRDFTARAVPS